MAEESVEWLLRALREPDEFVSRTTPSYLVRMQLSETLAGLAPVVGLASQRNVASFLTGVTEVDDKLHSRGLAWVVHALDGSAWSEIEPHVITEASAAHEGELARMLLRAAARAGDEDARDKLLERAREGELRFYAELEDGNREDPEVVRAVLDRDSTRLQERMADARAGKGISVGPHDAGEDLVIDSVRHPEHANWEPVFELLEGDFAMRMKMRALKTAAFWIDKIDPAIQERLGRVGLALSQEPPGPHSPFEPTVRPLGPGTLLAFAAAAISEGEAIRELQVLQAGEVVDRQWACHLAARLKTPESAGWLLAAGGDQDPLVRARAAESLVMRLLDGDDSPTVRAGIVRSLDETGTRVPLAVASVLDAADTLPESVGLYLEQLGAHPSNEVRRRADSAHGKLSD